MADLSIDGRLIFTPELLIPGRQPLFGSAYELDDRDELSIDLEGWWLLNDGSGLVAHNLVRGGIDGDLTNMDQTDWTTGRDGNVALDFGGTDQYVDVASFPLDIFSSDHTISFWVKTRDTAGAEALITQLCSVTNGYVLYRSAPRSIVMLYNSSSIMSYAMPSALDNEWKHIAMTRKGTAMELFFNGASVDTASIAGVTPTGDLWFGRREFSGGDLELNGAMDDIRIHRRSLSDDEIMRVYLGAIPLRPSIPWISFGAADGAIQLILQDASHGHAADNVALTQAHSLAISDSSHSHTAENVSLVQANILAMADTSHSHDADNVDLTTGIDLVPADADHSHIVDNVDLVQAHVLAIADALHAHASENVVLSTGIELIPADTAHTHTADNADLVQDNTLDAADASHGHTVDNVALTQAHTLAAQDALHAHSADTPTLSLAALLIVSDGTHAHTVGNVDLTQAHLLAVADALHAHAADAVVLSFGFTLVVADAAHSHIVENLDLTSGDILIPADALHAHIADNAILTQANILEIADALHSHAADNITFVGLGLDAGCILFVPLPSTTYKIILCK